MIREGEYFVRRRLGRNARPFGVYQRLGGQDIMVTAFTNEVEAKDFADRPRGDDFVRAARA